MKMIDEGLVELAREWIRNERVDDARYEDYLIEGFVAGYHKAIEERVWELSPLP